MDTQDRLASLDKATLVGMLEDQAKNWLAHDGLWFQAVERHHGMPSAIALDREAWIDFTRIEARRIMARHGIAPGGGLDALAEALPFRLYALLNRQSIHRVDSRTLRFEMNECRVQTARERKGLPDFPCKPVGLAEYTCTSRTRSIRASGRAPSRARRTRIRRTFTARGSSRSRTVRSRRPTCSPRDARGDGRSRVGRHPARGVTWPAPSSGARVPGGVHRDRPRR